MARLSEPGWLRVEFVTAIITKRLKDYLTFTSIPYHGEMNWWSSDILSRCVLTWSMVTFCWHPQFKKIWNCCNQYSIEQLRWFLVYTNSDANKDYVVWIQVTVFAVSSVSLRGDVIETYKYLHGIYVVWCSSFCHSLSDSLVSLHEVIVWSCWKETPSRHLGRMLYSVRQKKYPLKLFAIF